MSRVDFGKVYTIEHNVKVKSLGKVNRNSEEALTNQLKLVWANTLGAIQKSFSEVKGKDPVVDSPSIVSHWHRAYQILLSNGFSDEGAREVLKTELQLRQSQHINDNPHNRSEQADGNDSSDNDSDDE